MIQQQETGLAVIPWKPLKPDKIEIRRTKGGAFVVLADDRSSGELSFDEMLAQIVGLTVRDGYNGFPMRTRQETEGMMRRLESKIDPTDTDALREHEEYVSRRVAEDFPA